VVGEAVLLVETLRTDRAVECRLVEVPAPVDIEKGPRLKGFAAQIADVGPLAGVSAQVDGHLRGCGRQRVIHTFIPVYYGKYLFQLVETSYSSFDILNFYSS